MDRFSRYLLTVISSMILFHSCNSMENPALECNNCIIWDNPTIEIKSGIPDYSVSFEEAKAFAKMRSGNSENFSVDPIRFKEDTVLYVCNYYPGWMVLSADKRTQPIIAYGKDNSFVLDSIPLGLEVWLGSLSEDIYRVRYFSSEKENEHTLFWKRIAVSPSKPNRRTKSGEVKKWYAIDTMVYQNTDQEDVVPHLIQTKWGQGYPWNNNCPLDLSLPSPKRCYLGCTATAVGQLLFYMHSHINKPHWLYHDISCDSSISGKTSNIGFARNSFVGNSSRWSAMALSATGYSVSAISYAEDLMLDIGNRLGMEYSGNGSGAWPSVHALSTYYGLTCYKGNYSFSTVRSNLLDSIPVIIVAFDSSDHTRGHTWLIDGIHHTIDNYLCYKHFYYGEDWYMYSEYYDTWDDVREQYHHLIQDPSEDYIYTSDITYTFLLMNWGYDGSHDNGYYSMSLAWNVNSCDHLYNRKIYYGFH